LSCGSDNYGSENEDLPEETETENILPLDPINQIQ
jgi:hypothetical protein